MADQQVNFDPDAYPGERVTGSKENGNAAERWARSHYDLDPQDSDICPEHAHDAVDPRSRTPIEVKSCQIYYNGDGSRGRFQIWDYAHTDLIEAGGGYIFVVHEPHADQFTVYLHRPLSAVEVDDLIGNWHPIDHSLRPGDAKRTSLGQSAVFSDIQITRIDPSDGETDSDTESQADADPGEVTQAELMIGIKEVIREIEEQRDDQMAPHGLVVQKAVEKTGSDPETVESRIEILRKRGEIYDPAEDHHRVV